MLFESEVLDLFLSSPSLTHLHKIHARIPTQDRLVQLITKVVSENFYDHIPYFTDKFVPKLSISERLKEFFNLTVVSSVLVSSFIVYFKIGESGGKKKMLWSLSGDLRKFRPIQFCAKLAIVRCIVDSLFWLGHRLIHERGFYKYIHKFHHEHRNPRTLTNQHFTIIDFFVEALVPLVTAIQSLRAMSVSISPLEEALLGAYIVWLEAASHCGKPLPCSSLVAPLAPLYNHVLGNQWDRRNVEFHQTHHEILKCNYSITQWPDRLLGTLQWNRDKSSRKNRDKSTRKIKNVKTE